MDGGFARSTRRNPGVGEEEQTLNKMKLRFLRRWLRVVNALVAILLFVVIAICDPKVIPVLFSIPVLLAVHCFILERIKKLELEDEDYE
jgi:hypothetical protein